MNDLLQALFEKVRRRIALPTVMLSEKNYNLVRRPICQIGGEDAKEVMCTPTWAAGV